METPAARSRPLPSGLGAAAHVFALTGLAVAAPLFDLLSHQAEFLVAHDAEPNDLVLFALLLSFGLPGVLVLLGRGAALAHRSLGPWAQLALVAGLSGLVALPVLKRLVPTLPATPSLATAAVE